MQNKSNTSLMSALWGELITRMCSWGCSAHAGNFMAHVFSYLFCPISLDLSSENCCPRPCTQANVGCWFLYICVNLSLLKDWVRNDCFSSTVCWQMVSVPGCRNNILWLRYKTNNIFLNKLLQQISHKLKNNWNNAELQHKLWMGKMAGIVLLLATNNLLYSGAESAR